MTFLMATGWHIGELILLATGGNVASLQAPTAPPKIVQAPAKCAPSGFVMSLPQSKAIAVASSSRAKQLVLLATGVGTPLLRDMQEIRRGADGLFYLNASINGATVRFLIDTGASTIVLTKADAARAGVLPSDAAFNQTAETAGGKTTMARVQLAHVMAGPSVGMNVSAAIASDGLGVSLLGQSWLSQLRSVMIEGDRMVLR